MKSFTMAWLRASVITCCFGWTSQSLAAQGCVPGAWQSPPNNLFDSFNGSFPVQAESEHFQLRWADEFNTDPRVSLDILQQSMVAMEQVFAHPDYGLTGSGNGQVRDNAVVGGLRNW